MPKKVYKAGKVTEPEFEKSHAERLVPLMEQGLFDYEIMAQFGIASKTFYRWINEHEDFAHARSIGVPKRFAWWLGEGRNRMMQHGDKGVKTWTVIMNNMFREEGWISEYQKGSTNITIGNMNVVKTEPELLESIKANFKQLDEATKSVLLEAKPELKNLTLDAEYKQINEAE